MYISSHPTPRQQQSYRWPSAQRVLQYQNIATPQEVQHTRPTEGELDLMQFFDEMYKIARGE
jgi:hypothetical protein